MGILDNLKGLFSKQQKLEDLEVEDLRRARIELEREQEKVLRHIDGIEAQKADVDAKGRAERSVRKQKLLAQQILDLETKAKHYDRTLALFSKQQRIVDGLMFLKENKQLLAGTTLGKRISEMNIPELQSYVGEATVDGTVQLEKLQELLGVFELEEELRKPDEEDKQLAGIVARWQQEQESQAAVPGLEEPASDMEAAENER